MSTRPRALAGAILSATIVAGLAACTTGGGAATAPPSSQPTLRPTPTPITAPASTKEQAAALVLAANPMFTGTAEYDPNLIGGSRWWKATPLASGGWSIEVTLGWGDCPAGCIEQHVWTYEVTPVGAVTLVKESGDEVPSDLPA